MITGIARIDRHISPPIQLADGFTPCRLWTGSLNRTGYGATRDGSGKSVRVHRLTYTLLVGPIPEGLTIDHLCNVRHCVNPDHLEPVTIAENIRRAYLRRDRCKAGHPFTADSFYWNGRQRVCRPCGRARNAAQRAAERLVRPARPGRGENATHGKGSTYRTYGCRCEPCRRANTEDVRRQRARRREALGAA